MKTNEVKPIALLIGAEHNFEQYVRQEFKSRRIEMHSLKANLYPKKVNLPHSNPPKKPINGTSYLKSCFDNVKTLVSCITGHTLYNLCTAYRNNIKVLRQIDKIKIEKVVFLISDMHDANENVLVEKNRFLNVLKTSGINYTIVTYHALFSNFTDFLIGAQKGKLYLSGNIHKKFWPIHLKDLATACVDAIEERNNEICVGGPKAFTLLEIAQVAFGTTQKPSKIIPLPHFLKEVLYLKKRVFKSEDVLLPSNFCIHSVPKGCISKKYTSKSLEGYFEEKVRLFQNHR